MTSNRERRVLVIGGALIVGMLALSRGLPRWLAWQRDARGLAAGMVAEVARSEATARSLEEKLDSLEARKSRFLELAPLLLDAESPSKAAGALTALVSGAAQAAGVRVATIRVNIDTVDNALLRRIRVSAEFEGDVRGVATMIAALERGPELLAIRELTITQRDPAGPPDRPETLGVLLQVHGLAIDRTGGEEGAS